MIIVPRVALKNEVSTMFTRSLILRTMTMSRVELERQGCREALASIGSMSAPKRTPDWCHRSRRLLTSTPTDTYLVCTAVFQHPVFGQTLNALLGLLSSDTRLFQNLMPALLLYSSSGSL
jgi:hypothetical protein